LAMFCHKSLMKELQRIREKWQECNHSLELLQSQIW
jgi:hypothetical protein